MGASQQSFEKVSAEVLVFGKQEPAQQSKRGWQVTKSNWERIRLTNDVELNIRRPLSREDNKKVDRLLEAEGR